MAADGGQWGEWWTLPRLSHAEELFELVSDTIDQPIRSVHVEHIANPIDAIVEIGHVRTHVFPKGGSDIQIELVDHGSSEVVCHADIIGTGSDALGQLVDSAPIGTSVLGCVIYIKLCLMFRHVDIIQDNTIINRFDTPSCSSSDLFD